jgi:hypothetical protein
MKPTQTNYSEIDPNYMPEAIDLMRNWEYLLPVKYDFYKQYSNKAWVIAMAYTGVYQLITEELVEFVNALIYKKSALEICCGLGTLGRALKIPFIDRKVSEIKEAKIMFNSMRENYSPLNQDIKFPNDIEILTAHQAFIKYQPEWVVGCYVTPKYINKLKLGSMYGPQEEEFIEKSNYIHCGSSINPVHTKKPINKIEHWVIEADWLICRSSIEAPSQMRIWTKDIIDFEKMPQNLEFEYFKQKL